VCDSSMGYTVPIPSEYMNASTTTTTTSNNDTHDTVIFVTMRPQEEYVKGHGKYCLTSPEQDNRPIMGILNLSPRILSINKQSTIEAIMLHETMHILGFHVDLFRTRPRMTLKKSLGNYNEVLYTVSSPMALQQAKQFFACSTTDGIPLENKISKGQPIYDHMHTRDSLPISQVPEDEKAFSLLEKTIFGNDLMTGTYSGADWPYAPVIGIVTLGLMDDLNYYNVSYDSSVLIARESSLSDYFDKSSGNSKYGYRMGCSFLTQRCEQWSKSSGYFCDSTEVIDADNSRYCLYDSTRKAACTVVSYNTALPERYRHIKGYANMGSSDEWRDYCPMPRVMSGDNCATKSSSVNAAKNTKKYGEQYGSNSKCFISSVNRDIYALKEQYARCYETACGPMEQQQGTTQSVTYLFIKVGDSIWRKCPLEGGAITNDFDRFSGQVICPHVDILCPAGTVTANFNDQIVQDSLSKTKKPTPIDNISVPFWVWIIVGVVALVIVLILLSCGGFFLYRKLQNRRRWNSKNTVDLRVTDVDIRH